MHEQHGAADRIVFDRLQRLDVTLGRCIADDVHGIAARPVDRQVGIESRDCCRSKFGELHADARRRVGCHHAGAAAVGQDHELLGLIGLEPCQRLRGEEQFLQRVHAQHASAGNRCLENDVRARQRSRMRRGGALALR